METKNLLIGLTTIALLANTPAVEPSPLTETREQRDARMAWWREAKFGLFIHWGVYAVPAGSYNGERIGGAAEWILLNAKIPVAEYRAYARQFNPVKYDPEAWAKLAKDAGMKYIVITAKHHDGFALYPSDVTDWDIADATPYKKDLITPLAEAARRQGLKFGTYYSQAQDWTHPGGGKRRFQEGEGWDDLQKGRFDEYLAKIAVPQTREILTRIQPDVFWWDTPAWMTPERAKPLHDLLALRPGILSNNRLGGDYKGDTETPEQHVPATGFADRDWETCMTMNDTWGNKSYDHNWKSSETLIRNLVDIVSKGGNYLLNVGPTAEGEIPPPSIERLLQVGAWMKVNGGAIYGTTASPFRKLHWGRCTKQVDPDGGTLYFHVFDWPADGRLVVPGLASRVTQASLLSSGTGFPVASEDGNVVLTVPAKAPEVAVSVIAVKFSGPLQIHQNLPKPGADGVIHLGAVNADIHNNIRSRARLAGTGEAARVVEWNVASAWLSWDFDAPAARYRAHAEISGANGGRLKVELDKASQAIEFPSASRDEKRVIDLGLVAIPAAGAHTLHLRPDSNNWSGVELHAVRLVPVPHQP